MFTSAIEITHHPSFSTHHKVQAVRGLTINFPYFLVYSNSFPNSWNAQLQFSVAVVEVTVHERTQT